MIISTLLGEISALLAAVMWSLSSFLFTSASLKIGALSLNIIRMFVAVVLLLVTIPLFGIDFRISNSQIFLLGISGLLGLVIGDSFLFKSFQILGPRVAMLIMSLNPAMAAFLAFSILGEQIAFLGIIGIFVTIGGIMLVISERSLSIEKNKSRFNPKGLFYAGLGAFGQAGGLIFAKMAFNLGEINSLSATILRLIIAVIVMSPLLLFSNRSRVIGLTLVNDRKASFMIFFASILGPYLGITLSFIAVTNVEVGIASTLMSTVPIIMLPMSKFIYKEKLSIRSIVGAIFAIAGVALLFLI